ncbi:hypothetical protein JHW45_01025 [Paracoccus stylophorae]|uniref:Uncharacterized protein n=1 Tax=Paracoccus stylophorae TaxID=659350 RepID=A0ABY7SVG9_9RHOB|nr:hypothetical protein [Paracoccus stylophorae]WCR11030.1 hypothetical protein JHW45_01025 [Paracoccus stylophorae]
MLKILRFLPHHCRKPPLAPAHEAPESAIVPLPRPGAGHGPEVVPFFAVDPTIRKIIYTANSMEHLNGVIANPSTPVAHSRKRKKGGRNFRE